MTRFYKRNTWKAFAGAVQAEAAQRVKNGTQHSEAARGEVHSDDTEIRKWLTNYHINDHDWKWLSNVVFKNKNKTQMVTWTLGIWFLKSRQRGQLCIVSSALNCVGDRWSPITIVIALRNCLCALKRVN